MSNARELSQIATAIVVDGSKNVGVGTSSPSGKLHVTGGNTYLDGERVFIGGSSNNAIINNIASVRINIDSDNNGTGESFAVGHNQTSIDNNNILFLVNDNGNVGIGTTSPIAKLDVRGILAIANSGSSYWGLDRNDSDGALTFADSTTERMRIDTSGNLLVGTTTTSGGSRFNQSVNNYYGLSVENPSSTSGYGLLVTNNSGAQIAIFRSSGNNRLFIEATGTLLNSTGTYGSFSDQKLKENIVDTSPKLDKLMNVKVRNYNLIGEELKQIGFVAQELEQVFPSMVEETADKDEENNDLGTSTKFVKNSVLIPILVKAMQELKAIVDQQSTELDSVKAELQALKGAA